MFKKMKCKNNLNTEMSKIINSGRSAVMQSFYFCLNPGYWVLGIRVLGIVALTLSFIIRNSIFSILFFFLPSSLTTSSLFSHLLISHLLIFLSSHLLIFPLASALALAFFNNYSCLSAWAGFLLAALAAWKPTVNNATNKQKIAASPKIHQFNSVLNA